MILCDWGGGSLSCICLLCFYLNLFGGGNGGLGGGFFLFDILVLSFVFVFVFVLSCFFLKLVGYILSFIFLFEVGWSGVCPGGSGGGHRLLLYPVSPHRTTSYTLQSIDMFPKYTKNTQEIHKKYTNIRKKHKV